MADLLGDYQQNVDQVYNDDFEKVEKIPEQDEEVTTTSFTGEEAEEDRYESGTSEANASNPLLHFDDDLTPEPHREPLISFGSQSGPPEPTAPPAATSDFTSGMGETNRGFEFELEADTSPFIQPEPKVASEPVEVSKPLAGKRIIMMPRLTNFHQYLHGYTCLAFHLLVLHYISLDMYTYVEYCNSSHLLLHTC